MGMKNVTIVLTVEVEKDIPLLGELIAQRAYTLDGVHNVTLDGVFDVIDGAVEPLKDEK